MLLKFLIYCPDEIKFIDLHNCMSTVKIELCVTWGKVELTENFYDQDLVC